MRNRFCCLALLLAGLGFTLCTFAQTAPASYPLPHPSAQFRQFVDTFARGQQYRLEYPAGSQWMDGSTRYTALEPSAADPKQKDLVAYTTATGERSILVPAARFIPPGAKTALQVSAYEWSADNRQLLLFTDAQKVWRLYTRGDYWVLNVATGTLTRVGKGLPASSLMFAKFSPDGRSVGYVYANNIYVEETSSGQRRQLTTDGSVEVINGTSDWVTEEEFFLRDTFRWSPDSKSIAYLQFDQTGVGDFTLLNDTRAEYPQTFQYRYPQAGTTNAAVRIGVVAAAGGATRWLSLPGDPRQNYIPRFEWVGGAAPTRLALQYLNRRQDHMDVYLFDTATGDGHVLFTDRDAAWVDVLNDFTWLPGQAGGQDLLWLSERDGWRHAWRVTPDGKPHLLTNFSADVIETVGVDTNGGYLYFHASPDNAAQQYLYRARLDGTGAPERMTPAGESGYHRYQASPDGRVALHGWSTASQPWRFSLVELGSGKVLKQLASNDALAAKAKPQVGSGREFFQVSAGGGVRLNGYMVKPPDFDPAKKYPVLVYVYGEPASATVMDEWSGNALLEAAMAREGYLIVSFDNEGTPEPRGRAWRKSVHGAVGVLASQQQAAAIRQLAKDRAYIDPDRLAVWGWSGGGSMTLNMMFRYPGLFRAGMAVAPVADQRKYDTIYQERYTGLPQENAKGYHDGSPISFADGLAGNLLIVHGSGDDNVHFQATELLMNRLIELGKPFDFMDYPNRTHAINEGPGTTPHLYNLLLRYLEDHVPAGPLPR